MYTYIYICSVDFSFPPLSVQQVAANRFIYVFLFLPLSTKVILGDLDLPNISIDESESVASFEKYLRDFFLFFVSQFVY